MTMLCPHCHTANPEAALTCTLCGAVLHAAPHAPSAADVSSATTASPAAAANRPTLLRGLKRGGRGNPPRGATFLANEAVNEASAAAPAWPFRPLPALAIGLLLVPLLKQLWIPNYVFNFLATLVHEIGHSAFAWIMGMPSIPSVGLFGGGVTPIFSQVLPLCFAILAAMGWLAWQMRSERRWLIATLAAMGVYALLAFTSAAQNLVVAGGVLFELGGAVACFYWVLIAPPSTGLERPLYALWGWWMLLNRGSETWLMLRDRSYWDSHVIINSGLAEGLVNDLAQLCDDLNLSPTTVLVTVLVLCLSAVPLAFGLARLKQRSHGVSLA